jgi:hypothetical protein
MRFMVIVKANEESEAGVLPSEQLLTEMGEFNEELVKAGVLLAADGLHPSSKGVRVRFSGSKKPTVIDGPFAETRELRTLLRAIRPASSERRSSACVRK